MLPVAAAVAPALAAGLAALAAVVLAAAGNTTAEPAQYLELEPAAIEETVRASVKVPAARNPASDRDYESQIASAPQSAE